MRCSFVLVFVSAFAAIVHLSEACNNYKMRLMSVENCLGDDQVIMVDQNFTANLSGDCIITTTGCVTSKAFSTARIKYTLKKNNIVLKEGERDICEGLGEKFAKLKAKLELFGFPKKCPVPEIRKCLNGDKKVDISHLKHLLPMAAGEINIHADIEHDTGKSCLEIKFGLHK